MSEEGSALCAPLSWGSALGESKECSRSCNVHERLATLAVSLFAGLGLLITPIVSLRAPGFIDDWLFTFGCVCMLASIALAWARGLRFPRRIRFALGLGVVIGIIGLWASLNGGPQYRIDAPGPVTLPEGVARLPATIDTQSSLVTFRSVIGLLGLGLAVGILTQSIKQVWPIAVAVSASAVLLCIVAVILKTTGTTLVPTQTNPDSPFGWFEQHGQAGSYLILGLFATVGCFAAMTRTRWTALVGPACVLLILASLIGINISEAAAGIAVLLIFGLAWFWGLAAFSQHPRRMATGTYVGLTLAGLLLLFGLALWLGVAEATSQMLAKTGWRGRQLMWQSAWPIALDAGLFGYGPGSFKLLLPFSNHFVPQLYRHWIVTPYAGQQPVPEWCHAYNEYLQATVEWGWIGAAALFTLLWFPVARLCAIAKACSLATRNEAWLAAGLAAGLLGILMHAAIDTPFQSPTVSVAVALLAGAGWGWSVANRRNEGTDERTIV